MRNELFEDNEAFMSYDFGSQGVSASWARPATGEIVFSDVPFGEFAELGLTNDGVLPSEYEGQAFQPVAANIRAFDLVTRSLRAKVGSEGMKLVQRIGVDGQQHGSTYWTKEAPDKFFALNSSTDMTEWLVPALASPNARIWMTSSSGDQRERMTAGMGGIENYVNKAGCQPFERYTGTVIADVDARQPLVLDRTAGIRLIEQLPVMIMTGSFNSPMGYGGACGTALWDHRTKSWDPELLNLALEREGDGAAVLESMLTPIVAPGTALPISNFFSDMSGISTFARVYEPTGDNPGTRVTIKDREDGTPSTVISLGTSITGNIGLAEEQVDTSGNLALMFDYVGRPFYLVCRTNGTARWDEARDISRSDYKGQDRILSQYLDGVIANAGTARPAEILFNYAKNETFPEIKIYQKRHGFDQGNPKNDLRATIESSLADIAVHAGEFIPEGPVEVAGGGSKSPEVVRMLAAMLNRPIVVSEGSSEGACLGSNYAAQFFYLNEIRTTETPLAQIVGTASAGTLVEPNAALVRYYHQDGGYLDQFRAAQAPLLNKS